jgi:hypothetical protein
MEWRATEQLWLDSNTALSSVTIALGEAEVAFVVAEIAEEYLVELAQQQWQPKIN